MTLTIQIPVVTAIQSLKEYSTKQGAIRGLCDVHGHGAITRCHHKNVLSAGQQTNLLLGSAGRRTGYEYTTLVHVHEKVLEVF
jgi:hypothetical protein